MDIINFGFYKNLLIKADFNKEKAERLLRNDEPDFNDQLVEKQICKYCGRSDTEILHYLSYGRLNGYDDRKNVIHYFKIHCLKCLRLYDFRPDKQKKTIDIAANKVPFLSNKYKKEILFPMVMELKAIRERQINVMNRKNAIKNLQRKIARHLEINEPMVLGNWLIVKDKYGQVRIYDDKEKYYRAESYYQNVVKPEKYN